MYLSPHDFTPKNYIFSNFMGGGGGGGGGERRLRPPGSVPGASIQKLINIDRRRKLVEILVLILKK